MIRHDSGGVSTVMPSSPMACEAMPGSYWSMDWPNDVVGRHEPGVTRSWLPARRTAGIYPGGCCPAPAGQSGIHQADDSAKRFHPPSTVSSGMGEAITRPHSPLGPASIGWQSSVTSAGAAGNSILDTQLIGRRLSPIRAPPPGSHLGWPHSASLGATNECPSSGTPSGLETMSLAADDLASGASRPTPGARAGAWGEACAPAACEAREGAGAAPCQGRPARLPILNKAGRLVGYRQNSQCMAGARPGPAAPGRPTSAPSTPSSASCSGSFSEAGTGLPAAAGPGPARHAAAAGCAVPTPGWAGPVPAEFEAAAADPLLGFPDAANLLPGYVLGPVAGKGGFCTVRRALHAATGAQVAVKIIEKARLRDATDRERVEREVRVMRALNNHVNIVRVLESAETADAIYVVMEHCTGGSLLDHVRERKCLRDGEAALVFQQLLAALGHCHGAGIVHRDVKLENILFDGAGGVQLIDFGLCGFFVPGRRLRCHCGSPSYAAPEIVARREYDAPPVDVWSLGVVLFAMLAGYLPFHSKDKKALSAKIVAGAFRFPAWVDPQARDLLSRMLTVDPGARATLAECAVHPWVARGPRWAPPGVGAARLLRLPGDEATGAVTPDPEVLRVARAAFGLEPCAVERAVRAREASPLAATYLLLAEEAARVPGGSAAWARLRIGAAVAEGGGGVVGPASADPLGTGPASEDPAPPCLPPRAATTTTSSEREAESLDGTPRARRRPLRAEDHQLLARNLRLAAPAPPPSSPLPIPAAEKRTPSPSGSRSQTPRSPHSPVSWLSDRLHKGAALSPGSKAASLGALDRAPASPRALQGMALRAFSIPAYSPRLLGAGSPWTLEGAALGPRGEGHTVHTVCAEGGD
ncbi:SNRK1B [Auxenochlorella protothecoides x Auxenochlorella symbiontica]